MASFVHRLAEHHGQRCRIAVRGSRDHLVGVLWFEESDHGGHEGAARIQPDHGQPIFVRVDEIVSVQAIIIPSGG